MKSITGLWFIQLIQSNWTEFTKPNIPNQSYWIKFVPWGINEIHWTKCTWAWHNFSHSFYVICYSNTWYFLLDTCYSILVTRYLLLNTCYSIYLTQYMLLDYSVFVSHICYSILVPRYMVLDNCYLILFTCYLIFVIWYHLLDIYYCTGFLWPDAWYLPLDTC